MPTPSSRTYEPAPLEPPWPTRPIARAGGLTPVGLALAFLLALPVVAGGILLAWEVAGP
jgi:hypothetical protein